MYYGGTGPFVDAICNWWGSVNGPTHPSNTYNAGFQGDNVTDYVDFTPWLNGPYPIGTCQWGGPVTNLDTGEIFASIQAAIDDPDTLDGHTIKVDEGTYNESIVVNKSVSIVGDPTLDAMGGIGFWVQANDTLIENFTVTNSSRAFYVNNNSHNVLNVTLRNHTIIGCNGTGIEFNNVRESVVDDVIMEDIINTTGKAIGLRLIDTVSCNFTGIGLGNVNGSSYAIGFQISNSDWNNITTASDCGNITSTGGWVKGISLTNSNNNTIDPVFGDIIGGVSYSANGCSLSYSSYNKFRL